MGMNVTSIALGGLQAARERLDGAAGRIAQAATQDAGGIDTGSLVQDVVEQKLAALTYRANLGVLRTQDQMLGSLLDLHA